jgi:glycosyltransferase involved in cell wall biosynthesis
VNVLFVAQLLPWPLDNGAAHRVYHLLQWLSERHRVTLVVLAEEGKTVDESFPLWPRLARVLSTSRATCAFTRTARYDHHPPPADRLRALFSSPLPNFVRRWESAELMAILRDLAGTTRFDLVWAERSYIAEMVRDAGFRRVVVDVDDLESVVLFRLLARSPSYLSKPLQYLEGVKGWLYERLLLPLRFHRLLVCKQEDRRLFALGTRHKVFVVPNGVRPVPPSDSADEAAGELLFVGSLEYWPNQDAVAYFVNEVLPSIRLRHPGVRFTMVGARPGEAVRRLHNGADVVVAGSVPDLEPYYRRAVLVVVPMRLGGGTRIKVLEALMHEKAVVTTSIGVEGLELRSGDALEIADSAEAFADACVRLLGDAAARRRLAESGREQVLERFEWSEVLGKRLGDVLAP